MGWVEFKLLLCASILADSTRLLNCFLNMEKTSLLCAQSSELN